MVQANKSNFIVFIVTFGYLSIAIVQIVWAEAMKREALDPIFLEPIPNMTVPAGRDVTLPCVVDNLGDYRLAWIHTDRHTLLSLHDRLITRNSRYSLTHNNYKTWWLQIANVEERDSGEYMCQINTAPMKSQVGYLDVVVPPKIVENSTSSDVEVREGGDVNMTCRASGLPTPRIKWRREDNKEITIGSKTVSSFPGECLHLSKISRLHMGAYLCIASNGVPPSVSKRIMVNVKFPPTVSTPSHLIGAPLGTEVTLYCNVESHPRSIAQWTRDQTILLSSHNYENSIIEAGSYKVQMKLHIRNLRPEDFGSYFCFAKNSLGESSGTIKLYEIPRPTSSTEGAKTTILPSRETPQSINENSFVSTWRATHSETEESGEALTVTSNEDNLPSAAGHQNQKDAEGVSDRRARNGSSTHSKLCALYIVVFIKSVL